MNNINIKGDNMPKVSVIIPCYNQAQYLDESIDSVLAQTFQDFEIIVVDDGSDDKTSMKILNNYKKPKTKLIRTSNQGPSCARNTGIKIANGDYILPLDADDRIEDSYLEKAVNILDKHPEIGIVYCEAELFGKQSGKWDLEEYAFPDVLLHNCIFCTAMFRKSDWAKVGGYKKEMNINIEDWEFWLSLIEQGLEVYRIPEVLFYYRIKKVSRTSDSVPYDQSMQAKLVKFHRKLYEDNLDYIIESYYKSHTTANKLNHRVNVLNRELSGKNQKVRELNRIKSSRSWKLTKPLRSVGTLARKFKNAINNSFIKSIYLNLLVLLSNNKNAKISIIMANYNYAHLLTKAINSVISQSYDNWELIIIDDGSSDESLDIINEFINSNPKISLYQHENGINKGLNETLCLGLKKSNGKYIAFLEPDDWWETNYLKEKMDILNKDPRVKFIFNDVDLFSDEKVDLTWFDDYFKWQRKILSKLEMPCRCSKYFTHKNFVPTFSCVFVDKKTLLDCDLKSPIDSLVDFWLWTQLASKTDFYYINKKLTHWFRHGSSYIQNSNAEQENKYEMYSKARMKFIKEAGF